MAFDAQKHIRDNTLELHDFLSDLRDWEQTIKERDKKLKNQATREEPSGIPPVRGRVHSTPSKSEQQHVPPSQRIRPQSANKQEGQGQFGGIKQTTKGLNQSLAAAGHTYDYYRDKWDKFDMTAALREVDEEDVHKPPSGNATVKISQSGSTKNAEKQETSRISDFMPSSKEEVFGGKLELVNRHSNALDLSGPITDALSEKELGNEYFREKKFVQAIECYSHSIAIQPSAVTYANRAMAYIKIRRYDEAEVDCSEAIALDDRYVKAYSRRGTARKELGKFLAAVEDFEFALRLEPENKELKQQYLEARVLCEKNVRIKLPEKKVLLPIEEIQIPVADITSNNMRVYDDASVDEKWSRSSESGSAPQKDLTVESIKAVKTTIKSDVSKQKQDVLMSTQAAAARAAASAMTALAQKITAPKTSYEFVSLWKSFAGNRTSQAELLKIMNPSTLPKVFKDSLTAQMLADIIYCLELIFVDHASHVVEVLENLTKVGRFSMTVMCLTNKDKSGLRDIWDRVFLSCDVSSEIRDKLSKLCSKFGL